MIESGDVFDSQAGALVFCQADETVDGIAAIEEKAEKLLSFVLRQVAINLFKVLKANADLNPGLTRIIPLTYAAGDSAGKLAFR